MTVIKRTPEGLEWPIDRKIERDLRNWPSRKKQHYTNEHGDSNSENKASMMDHNSQGDGFKLENKN